MEYCTIACYNCDVFSNDAAVKESNGFELNRRAPCDLINVDATAQLVGAQVLAPILGLGSDPL